MSVSGTSRLRVAAIHFLNPAPLLFGFEHEPQRSRLLARYELHYTTPARCAEQLCRGEAGLGLVPIGALPFLPDLAVVPGCTIASLHEVRSIQLVVKPEIRLSDVRSVATDEASRSSAVYARILLQMFYGSCASFDPHPAELGDMLADHDAALLIGDPALFALEDRNRQGAFRDHQWFDVASLWRQHTGLPWVAAVWAVSPQALSASGTSAQQLAGDLARSRDAGLANVDMLTAEWAGRIGLPAATIHDYLTRNVHYHLDVDCLHAIRRFYELGEQTGVLPPYSLPLLPSD